MFYRTYHRIAAVAVLGAVALTGAAQIARAQAAPPEKKVKDQGEYDIYNQTLKDLANPAALLKDLDTWAQKYPDSDWKDDRQYYYISAYAGTNQPAKVLEIGSQLMARDLKKVYVDPKAGPQMILTVLYQIAVNLTKIPNPTAEQMQQGEAAAKQLQEFVPVFFTAANKDAKECVTGEASYRKALEKYPENALIAYQLGRALRCQQTSGPEKVPQALYEFARAAAIDPTLGGTMDPKALNNYLESAYSSFHGSLEGLDALKTMAKASPLPPADLKIETATAIATKKQAEFEQSNPQLALWMRIKGALADNNGTTYFENELKDSGVPPMKGTLLEGKPACKSKELLVAIPLPDAQGNPVAEITLKLDTPLAGKPETGTTIQWTGVPKAFTKDPFMLTMEVEKAKVENVKTSPCAAAPAKKAVTKKK